MTSGLARLAAALACVLASACDVGGVNGGDDDPGADASPPVDDGGNPIEANGVSVEFVYLGSDGEPVNGDDPIELEDLTVYTVTFQLHALQLIGDTAPAGDLVVPSRTVEYPRDDEARVSYSAAPPGLYSRFNFDVERAWADEELPDGFGDQRLSIRVTGEAKLQGNDREFDYTDDEKVSIDLDFAQEAQPGVHRTIIVEVDLAEWFSGLDWDAMSSGQGGGNEPILIGMGNASDVALSLRERVSLAFEARD